jgi:hypothetical protein
MLRVSVYLLCFVGAVWSMQFATDLSRVPDYGSLCCICFACSISTINDLTFALSNDVQKWRTQRSEDIEVDNIAE